MTVYPATTIGKVSGIEYCHNCQEVISGIRYLVNYPGCNLTRTHCMNADCAPSGHEIAMQKYLRKCKKVVAKLVGK